MIRFALRAISALLLTGAVLFGLLDASRTVALDRFIATPLGEELSQVAPDALQGMRDAAVAVPLGERIVEGLFQLPAWLVLGLLALLFGYLGRRRVPQHLRYLRS